MFWKNTVGFPAPADEESIWQFVVDPRTGDTPAGQKQSPSPQNQYVAAYRSDVNAIWPFPFIEMLPLKTVNPAAKQPERVDKLRRWSVVLVRQQFAPTEAKRLPENIREGMFVRCAGDPRVFLINQMQKRHVLHAADVTGPVLEKPCHFLDLLPLGVPFYRVGPYRAT
jgi:hypothetical protein